MLSEGAKTHIGITDSAMSVTDKVKKKSMLSHPYRKPLKLFESSVRKDRQVMAMTS
jgi:hypothetical protein